ncbi:helix-turn-helix domain-containing protein [Gracilibacillus caseinilyticus]|uniref:Helix-turn-helix domain-containing protein n=1 Tax=Gracilibacillus caseinilyticus TaxID=2932256 RepID=A0ABY4EZY4_9BACI|nr:helix-turn-helix domain-containing protein [Gracilibacillus caseinilyticus]UOQ49412.1 helix-turn-helix domain-containing protein [Gracilibacillus caseinilyticus]
MSNETLYELAQKSKEDRAQIEKIVERFEPKIKSSLTLTSPPVREDLYQELRLKLIDIILNYDIDSTPGFWRLQKDLRKNEV